MKQFLQSARGSVMMEFIIVFPIYLVLFAAIMALGDMLVHSIRLPSAERTAAFDVGAAGAAGSGWSQVLAMLFPAGEIADDGTRQDNPVQASTLDHSADTTIQGPWSMTSGSKVRNDYKLLVGGVAGQLAFADWYFSDVTKTSQAGGDFGNLISGGSIAMYSKGSATTYNYITLKRRRNMGGLSWRDNGRNSSDLVVYGGWQDVGHERFANGSATVSNSDSLRANPRRFDPASYTRYPQFVTWSN